MASPQTAVVKWWVIVVTNEINEFFCCQGFDCFKIACVCSPIVLLVKTSAAVVTDKGRMGGEMLWPAVQTRRYVPCAFVWL